MSELPIVAPYAFEPPLLLLPRRTFNASRLSRAEQDALAAETREALANLPRLKAEFLARHPEMAVSG